MYLMVDYGVVFNQPFLWEQPEKSKEVYIFLNSKNQGLKITKSEKPLWGYWSVFKVLSNSKAKS